MKNNTKNLLTTFFCIFSVYLKILQSISNLRIILLFCFFFPFSSFATIYYAKTTGNWNVAANWVTDACGGTTNSTGLYPAAGDEVFICAGKNMTVNVNVTINNITIQGNGGSGNGNNGIVSVSSGFTLTVSGNLVFDNINNSGTYCLSGVNSTSIINVGGNFTVNSNCTYSGIFGTGWSVTFSVTGASQIDGFLRFNNGVLATYNGDVTINGTWSEAGSQSGAFTFNKSFYNYGTFTSSSNFSYTFGSAGSETIGGTNAITFNKNLILNTGTYQMDNPTLTLPLNYNLTGTGTLVMGANTTLNLGNNSNGIASLDASTNTPNTVNYTYNGYAATAIGTTYYNLNFTNSGGYFFLSAPITVNNNLSISSGVTLTSNKASPTSGFTNTVLGTTTINGTTLSNYASDIWNLQDVTLNGGGYISGNLTGTYNINGTFNVASSTASIGRSTMNFNGVCNINAALNLANFYNGIKTFAGLVTIGSSGSWTTGGALTVGTAIFQGGITVVSGGSFFHNPPSVTFNTNPQSLIGTMTFGQGIIVTGVTVTNYGTININQLYNGSNLLTGTGSWVQGENSTLNTGGNVTITTFDATASGNSVIYNSAGANYLNIRMGTSNTFYNLTLTGGSTGATSFPGAITTVTISGDFTLSSGSLCYEDGPFGGIANIINVSGTTTITGNSTMRVLGNAAPLFTTQYLVLDGGTINHPGTNIAARFDVSNNFTVNSGSSNTIDRTYFRILGGTSAVQSGAILNFTTNINTPVDFRVNLTIENTATVSLTGYTVATGNAIFGFRNGLTVNGGTFNATRVYFNNNSQTLSGAGGNINFSDIVFVNNAAITVTNNHPNVNMTNTGAGVLTGVAGGSWTQGTGTLHYWGSTITITSFSASNSGNTVDYAGNVAQAIFNPNSGTASTYYNLSVTNSANKTIAFPVFINGNILIGNYSSETTVLSVASNAISVKGSWSCNSGNATPFSYSAPQAVTFNNSVTSSQVIGGTGSLAFYNLTINNTSGIPNALQLGASISVANFLSLQSGLFDLNGFNIDLNNTGSLSGESATTYIYDLGQIGGYIHAQRNLTIAMTSVGYNMANLGSVITEAGVDLGITDIYRGHKQQTEGTNFGISRYYDISPATPPTNASLTFSYLSSDIPIASPEYDESLFSLYYSTVSPYNLWTIAPSVVDQGAKTVTTSGLSHFSRWTVSDKTSHPLPVNLISFNASQFKNIIDITWVTNSEINNDFFTVQRSVDAVVFTDLLTVDGAGNSNELRSYFVQDTNPSLGLSYYRIKQTDYDGKSKYSHLVAVDIKYANKYDFIIYPNPTSKESQLSCTFDYESYTKIIVSDIKGKIVNIISTEVSKGYNSFLLNVADLAPGIYYCTLLTTFDIIKKKIIKN